MSSLGQIAGMPQVLAPSERWFAIQTRPQHEKNVARQLIAKGITTYLPLLTERHRWSDREKIVQVPLFSCYTFVAIDAVVENRIAVLCTPGVLSFVGSNHDPTPIPESDIENVRTLLGGLAQFSEHAFLKVGQRVRIRGGSLQGLEGILVARNGERALVISIDAIQRSLVVHIEGYDLEPV
jgi:transcription antitermination factor NusG